MAKDNPLLDAWSQQTTTPTTPHERIRALLKSPLGSSTWANPLRLGPFTVHDFWEVRREKQYQYNTLWPTEPVELAQLMLKTGLQSSEIDLALRVEQTDKTQSITNAMQMHQHLRAHFNLPTDYQAAIECLTTVFEARVHHEFGKGTVDAAFRSVMHDTNNWTVALHSLVQYDNSEEAQNAYFAHIQNALLPAKEQAPTGALPARGRHRLQMQEERPYLYGWGSTGSTMVQALPQADNAALTEFLYNKHDVHGLGAMVVQNRLALSQFLELVANPASTPQAVHEDKYGSPVPFEQQHFSYAVEVLSTLSKMLPQETLVEQSAIAIANNPTVSDKWQAMVAAPSLDTGVWDWWTWNSGLHAMGLVDAAKPSMQMQHHLEQAQSIIPTKNRQSDTFSYKPPETFDLQFGAFAAAHSVLANMGLAFLLRSVPYHSKPTEVWEKMKDIDLKWLSQAQFSRVIDAEVLNNSIASHNKHSLPFAAMMLPHMNPLDQARIAPLVAYGVGVKSVSSLSPSTLRNMWKEHDPDTFKATIPRQYSGDTYILYALTRKNADDLMKTLSAMDVRHDVTAYLECVEAWTRQAMDLPPLIDDIGPTDNLFGV